MTLTQIKPAGLSTPVDLADNAKIRLGASNDLQIFHDGSHSYIANSTGNLYINAPNYFHLGVSNGGDKYITALENGVVDLYYDGSKKFETTSLGATVTGKLGVGTTSPSLPLDVQGANNTTFDHVGTINLQGTDAYNSGNAGAGILFSGKFDSSGNITTLGQISGIKEDTGNGTYDGALTFGVRNDAGGLNIERARISSSGNVGIGTAIPSRRLVVAGDTNTVVSVTGATNGTSSLFLGDTDDEDVGALTYNHTTDDLTITAADNIILSGDAVGIGTTSPDSLLHLSHASAPLLSFTSTDTQLTTDQLIGGIKVYKSDASGSGTGISGSLLWRSEDSYGARSYISFTNRLHSTGQTNTDSEVLKITGTGDVEVKTGNIKIDTAGKGINFSAFATSGNPSSNLLDDYEEGTWTPNVGGANSGTYSSRQGLYTKIGSLVYISYYVNFSNVTANASHLFITDLPFTANDIGAGSVMMNAYNFGTCDYIVSHTSNSASLSFYETSDNGSWNAVPHDSTASIIGTHVYRTDS